MSIGGLLFLSMNQSYFLSRSSYILHSLFNFTRMMMFSNFGLMMSNKPSEIIPGKIYLGGRASSTSIEELSKRNIQAVVSITDLNLSLPSSDLKHLHIREHDVESVRIIQHFPNIFSFVDDALSQNQAVLIHCEAGVSRSATTVIAYLMEREGMELEQAFAHTKTHRPIICPNRGFVSQLVEFQISKNPSYDPVSFYSYYLLDNLSLRNLNEDVIRRAVADSSPTDIDLIIDNVIKLVTYADLEQAKEKMN